MQITKKRGRILCSHKFNRGLGQLVLLGDKLDTERLYFYQTQCVKCGRTIRLIGTSDEIVAWKRENETA